MKKDHGFTLIELLITIAIIGVLASMTIPALIGSQRRSYDTGAQACAKSIETVQGLSQIDNRTYMPVGSSDTEINKSTDGINSACKSNNIFINDRSNASTMVSDYVIDVWDRRGDKVFTITPSYLKSNASGATAFSDTGSGGVNLP